MCARCALVVAGCCFVVRCSLSFVGVHWYCVRVVVVCPSLRFVGCSFFVSCSLFFDMCCLLFAVVIVGCLLVLVVNMCLLIVFVCCGCVLFVVRCCW